MACDKQSVCYKGKKVIGATMYNKELESATINGKTVYFISPQKKYEKYVDDNIKSWVKPGLTPDAIQKMAKGVKEMFDWTNGCTTKYSSFLDYDLIKLETPDQLTEIKQGFNVLANLQSIKLNEGLLKIGPMFLNSFRGANKVMEHITIPNSVKELGSNFFSDDTALKTITLGTDIEKVGTFSFNNAINLKEIIFNNHLKTIEDYFGKHAKGLIKVVIPTLENLGQQFLDEAPNIKEFTLPLSIKTKMYNPFNKLGTGTETFEHYITTKWPNATITWV